MVRPYTKTHVDMLDYHRCTTRDGKNPLVMRLDGNYRDNENHASPSHIVGVKVYDHEVSANGTPSKVVRYLVKQVGNRGRLHQHNHVGRRQPAENVVFYPTTYKTSRSHVSASSVPTLLVTSKN